MSDNILLYCYNIKIPGCETFISQLPACMMLLGKTNEILDLDAFALIGDHLPMVAAEHLVHLAEDHSQVSARHPFLEGVNIRSRRPLLSVNRQGFI